MPTTRLEKPARREKKAPAKSVDSRRPELFERPEQPAHTESGSNQPTVPFSDPSVVPALKKLRQVLQRDSITEMELLGIVKESSPRQTLFLDNLDQIPARTAELCLQRWPTIMELVQASRDEDPETA